MNKLKLIKRSMDGRAHCDVRRIRVLSAAEYWQKAEGVLEYRYVRELDPSGQEAGIWRFIRLASPKNQQRNSSDP